MAAAGDYRLSRGCHALKVPAARGPSRTGQQRRIRPARSGTTARQGATLSTISGVLAYYPKVPDQPHLSAEIRRNPTIEFFTNHEAKNLYKK